MANIIQATVVNIDGINVVPFILGFPSNNITIQEQTLLVNGSVSSRIVYMSGPYTGKLYYVTESVATLVTAANTGGTTQVQLTCYEFNSIFSSTPFQVGIPASGIIITPVTGRAPINSQVNIISNTYLVSELEADIITAANAGGGGGGAVDSVFGRTGVVTADAGDYASFYVPLTATGNVAIDMAGHQFQIISSSNFSFTATSVGAINFSSAGLFVEDDRGTPKGLEYDNDYSANYTDRSLVDKGWVVAQIAAIPAGINGTMSANRIPYGVDSDTLTTSTALTFDGTDILTLAGTPIRSVSGGFLRIGSTNGVTQFLTSGVSATVSIYDSTAGGSLDFTALSSAVFAINTTGANNLRLQTAAAGGVAIGNFNPTSKLHIAAGTATLAPLGLTAGTLLTTPLLGTMEYVDDGTTGHLYFTYKVATVTTRREFTLT